MPFTNKTVLVTGGSRGIGRAISIAFAKEKANIVINYLNNEKEAEIVRDIIETYGVKSIIIKADVSKEKDVKRMIKETFDTFGSIDILINNAGIAIDLDFDKKEVKDWTDTLNTNLVGTFLTSKYAKEYMLKQKKGKIINISSTNGYETTSPYSLDYDASKAGIINLTRNLAQQFAPYINVNSIAPGWVDTDMNKDLPEDYMKEEKEKIFLKRFAEPEEIANVAVFLASDKARYINGETIRVDGGI